MHARISLLSCGVLSVLATLCRLSCPVPRCTRCSFTLADCRRGRKRRRKAARRDERMRERECVRVCVCARGGGNQGESGGCESVGV
ncbi:hypothetical protein BC939DRAFT_455917 [Gamsiella multidivaricata]|uniref:uncharacterized protein n=1 Tax=Gamsiella multidivaricata TaxID=101098 RepID=UPI0022210FFD|nr:uncharacterized protein BC939DRAFT_455917 [Gamsiella multidivaricata]KAI7821410.1 hypothetical protein BC939DRAFT_455917 [Gamsiella multidivaricata]